MRNALRNRGVWHDRERRMLCSLPLFYSAKTAINASVYVLVAHVAHIDIAEENSQELIITAFSGFLSFLCAWHISCFDIQT